MTNLVTYCHDGSHFMVEPDAVPLLKRGWAVRVIWRRKHGERTLGAWLRYLVTTDGWGIGGSAHSPDLRVRRVGPVFVDYLAGPVDLIVDLMQARAGCAYFVAQAQEQAQARHTAESLLGELRARQPGMRGGAA
jgi:hypothetical protein